MLDRETWTDFQFALASFGTALLIVELVLHRRGWSHRFSVPRDALLGGVALLSVLAWWTPVWVAEGRPETALGSVHMTDAFHYYMGPKYFPELGFTQLYVCTAAAEVELGGRAEVAKRVYRDLETNEGITGRAILAKAGSCRERFTPEAWERFVQDVDFFRQRVPFWALMMQDWATTRHQPGTYLGPCW